MGDADMAAQHRHARFIKHIAYQPVALVHAQPGSVCGGDTRRVLAPVLQDSQAVIQLTGDVRGANNSDNATHACAFSAEKP